MSQENANTRVITSTCSTGWADRVPGELWLLRDGLLRVPSAQMDAEEIPELATARRYRWIPRDQVSEARLRKGLFADRLKVALADGSRIKLLWLKRDPAYAALRPVLGEWLGSRLKLTGSMAAWPPARRVPSSKPPRVLGLRKAWFQSEHQVRLR